MVRIIKLSLLALIFIFILFGNVFVILSLLLKCRKLKLNRMYFFLINLTVADLITGFFNVLPQLAWEAAGRFYGGNALCKIVKFLQLLGPYLSSYVLVMTSIDRYQAICNPLANNLATKTNRRSKWMIAIAWLISMSCCSPQLFIFSYVDFKEKGYECWGHFPEPWTVRLYVTWYAVSVFIVPFVIVSYTHVIICYEIYRNWHSKRQSLMFKETKNTTHYAYQHTTRDHHQHQNPHHNQNSKSFLPPSTTIMVDKPQSCSIAPCSNSVSGLRLAHQSHRARAQCSTASLTAAAAADRITLPSSRQSSRHSLASPNHILLGNRILRDRHKSITDQSETQQDTENDQHLNNRPFSSKCSRTWHRLMWICNKSSSQSSNSSLAASNSSIRLSASSRSSSSHHMHGGCGGGVATCSSDGLSHALHAVKLNQPQHHITPKLNISTNFRSKSAENIVANKSVRTQQVDDLVATIIETDKSQLSPTTATNGNFYQINNKILILNQTGQNCANKKVPLLNVKRRCPVHDFPATASNLLQFPPYANSESELCFVRQRKRNRQKQKQLLLFETKGYSSNSFSQHSSSPALSSSLSLTSSSTSSSSSSSLLSSPSSMSLKGDANCKNKSKTVPKYNFELKQALNIGNNHHLHRGSRRFYRRYTIDATTIDDDKEEYDDNNITGDDYQRNRINSYQRRHINRRGWTRRWNHSQRKERRRLRCNCINRRQQDTIPLPPPPSQSSPKSMYVGENNNNNSETNKNNNNTNNNNNSNNNYLSSIVASGGDCDDDNSKPQVKDEKLAKSVSNKLSASMGTAAMTTTMTTTGMGTIVMNYDYNDDDDCDGHANGDVVDKCITGVTDDRNRQNGPDKNNMIVVQSNLSRSRNGEAQIYEDDDANLRKNEHNRSHTNDKSSLVKPIIFEQSRAHSNANASIERKSNYPAHKLTHSTSSETGPGSGNVLVPRSYQINRIRQPRLSNPRIHSMQGLTRAKIKTVKITLVVITCYILCSSPFICVQLWSQYWPGAQESSIWKGPVIAILMLLPSLNSCVNPWIYIYFNPNLVTSFCAIFGRKSSSNSNQLHSVGGAGAGGVGGEKNSNLARNSALATANMTAGKRRLVATATNSDATSCGRNTTTTATNVNASGDLIYGHRAVHRTFTNDSAECSNSMETRSTSVRDNSRLDLCATKENAERTSSILHRGGDGHDRGTITPFRQSRSSLHQFSSTPIGAIKSCGTSDHINVIISLDDDHSALTTLTSTTTTAAATTTNRNCRYDKSSIGATNNDDTDLKRDGDTSSRHRRHQHRCGRRRRISVHFDQMWNKITMSKNWRTSAQPRVVTNDTAAGGSSSANAKTTTTTTIANEKFIV